MSICDDIFFCMDVQDFIAWIAFPFLIPVWCLYSIRVSKQLSKISGRSALVWLSYLGLLFYVASLLLHMRVVASTVFALLSILYPLAIIVFAKIWMKRSEAAG